MKKRFITSLLSVLFLLSCVVVPASATSFSLSDETKQAYYNQYIDIAEEVSNKTGSQLSVLPMSEFSEEDWISPETYRDLITAIATWHPQFGVNTDIITSLTSMNSIGVRATKSSTLTVDGYTFTLDITGVFLTYYDSFHNRQLFDGYESITSELASSTGSWKQVGYETELLDGRRTYKITVSGDLTVAGTSFDKIASVYFYCGSNGSVT